MMMLAAAPAELTSSEQGDTIKARKFKKNRINTRHKQEKYYYRAAFYFRILRERHPDGGRAPLN